MVLPLLMLLAAGAERPAGFVATHSVVTVAPGLCEGKTVPLTTRQWSGLLWPAKARIRVAGRDVAQAPKTGPFSVLIRSTRHRTRAGGSVNTVTGCPGKNIRGQADLTLLPLEAELYVDPTRRVFLRTQGSITTPDGLRSDVPWQFGNTRSTDAGVPAVEPELVLDGEALRAALRTNRGATLEGAMRWTHALNPEAPQRVSLSFSLVLNATVAEVPAVPPPFDSAPDDLNPTPAP